MSVLMPGIWVRSTPNARYRSSRNWGGSFRQGVLRGFFSFESGFSPMSTLAGSPASSVSPGHRSSWMRCLVVPVRLQRLP